MNTIGTNAAINIARTSDHKFRVGSAILKGRRILSVGTNKSKTSPFIHKKIDSRSLVDRLHSEMACIMKAGSQLNGATIYIARLNKDGTTNMSRPCRLCMMLIREAGIKKAFYTIGDDSWEELKI
jgi:deoxycytidylate deaminase